MRTNRLFIRGLNLHIQEWGEQGKPLLFLLHGWMDCGATFKYVAEHLQQDFHIIAPDLRGFGRSDHAPSYWFPDYFADLEKILDHYEPYRPVNLLGHSMGGNIVMMYAGINPQRVQKVMSLEALGLRPSEPSEAPGKYRQWMRQVLSEEPSKVYPHLDALRHSIYKGNPSLRVAVIEELADLWGEQIDATGAYRLRHDHAHRYTNPVRYNYEDTLVIWQEITAKVGLVMADNSSMYQTFRDSGRIDEVRAMLNIGDDAYFLIEQCAHMLHLEQPRLTAECIQSFFRV